MKKKGIMKFIYLLLIGILTGFAGQVSAQSFETVWETKTEYRGLDFFTDVIEDKNSGFTVLGSKKNTETSHDFWIIRYDQEGNILWSETVGTENKDIPKRIIQLSDKGYIVMGKVQIDSSEQLLLVKLDETGKETWRKLLDSSGGPLAEDMIALKDNGFVLGGSVGKTETDARLWMAKAGNDGEFEWEKSFDELTNGSIKTIKELPVGGFVAAAVVNEAGKKDCDLMLLRTSPDGSESWSSRVKSPGQKIWPECVCCSTDSCFVVVGWLGNCLNDISSENAIFDYDMILYKIDRMGKVLWTKNFDKEGSEGGNTMAMQPDGGYILGGIKATSFLGKVGPWMVKVDAEGNELQEKLLPFHFNNDQVVKVINCSDGGIVLIGPGLQDDSNTRSDGWIMKMASL